MILIKSFSERVILFFCRKIERILGKILLISIFFRLQVNVRTMCVDGARDVIFKSATKCSCYFCKKYWTLLRDVMVWTKEESSYTTNKQNPVQKSWILDQHRLTHTHTHAHPPFPPTLLALSLSHTSCIAITYLLSLPPPLISTLLKCLLEFSISRSCQNLMFSQ